MRHVFYLLVPASNRNFNWITLFILHLAIWKSFHMHAVPCTHIRSHETNKQTGDENERNGRDERVKKFRTPDLYQSTANTKTTLILFFARNCILYCLTLAHQNAIANHIASQLHFANVRNDHKIWSHIPSVYDAQSSAAAYQDRNAESNRKMIAQRKLPVCFTFENLYGKALSKNDCWSFK